MAAPVEDVHTFEPHFDTTRTKRFVLRWNAVNYNAASASFTLPQIILDQAATLSVQFDALSIRYNGNAAGVVVNRAIVYGSRQSATVIGTTVGQFTTAVADETHVYPLYGLPFVWAPDWVAGSDPLILTTQSGYNAADDMNVALWGRVVSTQETPNPGGEPPERVILDSVVWPPKTRRF